MGACSKDLRVVSSVWHLIGTAGSFLEPSGACCSQRRSLYRSVITKGKWQLKQIALSPAWAQGFANGEVRLNCPASEIRWQPCYAGTGGAPKTGRALSSECNKELHAPRAAVSVKDSGGHRIILHGVWQVRFTIRSIGDVL